jgi:GMP synthase-like glutamine amidotransferase
MNILIIYFDFFCKNLIKRFIEYNIKAFITKYENAHNFLDYDIDIVIIAGSEKRILRDNNFPILEQFIKKNIHIIGICFGFHYLAFITNGILREDNLHQENEIIKINGKYYLLYYSHNDKIYELNNNWNTMIKKDNYIIAAKTNKFSGYQFHPERYRSTFEIFLLPLLKK